ncbi:MAG: MBL fold metallo-hydrolase [Ruminococcaceae bacterium]|nr:MBL fold metallo-hydrolase [Oscillospiraceae bacterium]
MKSTLKTALCLLLVICSLAFLVACLDDTGTQEPGATETTTVPEDSTEPKNTTVAESTTTAQTTTGPESTTTAQTTTGPESTVCQGGCSYEVVQTLEAATCGKAGKEKVKCSVCGNEIERDIPATGAHEEKDDWEVVREATRYLEGKLVKGCKNCPYEMQTEAIPCDLDVDLSSYSVIYDASVSAKLFGNSAKILANSIGHSATANNDSKIKNANATQKEILIGETDRPESAAALALLDKDGFAITYTNGRIAIIGTNTAQTIYGVNYFIDNFIDGDGKAADLPDSTVQAITEIQLMTSSSFGYTFVYDADLDDDKSSNPYGNGAGRDYNCIAIDELSSFLSKTSGLSGFSIKKDTLLSTKEILVGAVDRSEYWEIARTIDANEYAIAVKGNKIILAAWNERAMEECVSDFKELLKDIKEVTSSKTVWNLPSDFYAKGIAVEKWVTDFPRPDEAANIELSRSIDANNDSLQFIYTGSGVKKSAFEAYCQKLTAAGYTMRTTNTIENSIFRLYVNEAKGIVLNVAYNDYKYASNFFSAEKKASEGKYYVEYEKSIRVTSSPIDAITVPDSSITTPNPTYKKVTDSKITAMGIERTYVGMSYIITLEDGSFVVYDGGLTEAKVQLWNTLVALHTEIYGSAPTTANPIRVSAWIITHAHHDHYTALYNMLKDHQNDTNFRMDYLIATFPSQSMLYPAVYDLASGRDETNEMNSKDYMSYMLKYAKNGREESFKFIKAFSGQKLYFANLELEVLMTWDDHPSSFFDTNDTSTVTRLSIGSTSAAKGATTSAASAGYKTTAIFLGDARRYQSRYLCAMYGSYLESEMVQVAHHANNGCEKEVYKTINPKVALIPNTVSTARGYLNGTSPSSLANEVGRYLMGSEITNLKYIIVSNENYAATIPLSASGAKYDALYDVWTNTSLAFKTSISYNWNGYLKKD